MKGTLIRPLLTIALAIVFLNSVVLSRAVPGDEHWDVLFAAPGLTNVNYAIAVSNGIVYAAGVAAEGRTNAPLSAWYGNEWSTAAIFNGPNLWTVNDLAFVGNSWRQRADEHHRREHQPLLVEPDPDEQHWDLRFRRFQLTVSRLHAAIADVRGLRFYTAP